MQLAERFRAHGSDIADETTRINRAMAVGRVLKRQARALLVALDTKAVAIGLPTSLLR